LQSNAGLQTGIHAVDATRRNSGKPREWGSRAEETREDTPQPLARKPAESSNQAASGLNVFLGQVQEGREPLVRPDFKTTYRRYEQRAWRQRLKCRLAEIPTGFACDRQSIEVCSQPIVKE
jgi:hypothetical protein